MTVFQNRLDGIIGQPLALGENGDGSAAPIQQIESVFRANPQPPLPVFPDSIYLVVAQTLRVFGVVPIGRELLRPGVEADQPSIRSARPQRSGSILEEHRE